MSRKERGARRDPEAMLLLEIEGRKGFVDSRPGGRGRVVERCSGGGETVVYPPGVKERRSGGNRGSCTHEEVEGGVE